MIKINRGIGETKGTKKEILVDFAGIVNYLHTNCEIPKDIILDFVDVGLSPDKNTRKKVIDIFEKMSGANVK